MTLKELAAANAAYHTHMAEWCEQRQDEASTTPEAARLWTVRHDEHMESARYWRGVEGSEP